MSIPSDQTHGPRCGRPVGDEDDETRRGIVSCGTACRSRAALKVLRRFRRHQLAMDQEASAHAATWFGFLSSSSIVFGILSLRAWPFTGPSLVCLFCCLLFVWYFVFSKHQWGTSILHVVLRIPVILFYEARFHLLELMMIIALLGHGVGMIVVRADATDLRLTVLYLIGWTTMVLGGAAWGLLAAQELGEESWSRRCALILFGILMPAAVIGLGLLPVFALGGLAILPGKPVTALTPIVLALLGTASALYVLGRFIHYQSKVSLAANARTGTTRCEQRLRRQAERTVGDCGNE